MDVTKKENTTGRNDRVNDGVTVNSCLMEVENPEEMAVDLE